MKMTFTNEMTLKHVSIELVTALPAALFFFLSVMVLREENLNMRSYYVAGQCLTAIVWIIVFAIRLENIKNTP